MAKPEVLNIPLFSHVPDLVTRPSLSLLTEAQVIPIGFLSLQTMLYYIPIHGSYVFSLLFL